MIKNINLSNLDIDYILNLPEVINAKYRIDSLYTGSIYFNIDLDYSLREILQEKFGLDFSKIHSIPMRWIKGDTKPHIDRGAKTFDKTYLAYLTDSPGELIIDSKSYPINKGNAYIFDEGLSHETIETGFEPRLLLGPMSESGISVGGSTIIQANGATDIIYIRYDGGEITKYKINNGSYNNISTLPIYIQNTNPLYSTLQVLFENDIVLVNPIWYIVCNSASIQFGSTSLNNDGTRRVITLDTLPPNYPGLIRNGTNSSNGFNNIYVFNLDISVNTSTLESDGGWIGQSYFGKSASNNFIVNCSSNGQIIDGGGGIVGAYSGSESGASLNIIGCSSSGNSAVYSGGIIGMYAGQNGGQVICESCWSTGAIGDNSGGIFGFEAGNNGGLVEAIKCYSTGTIIGNNAGGIFGKLAATSGSAEANACYSNGAISGGNDGSGTGAGGIYGSGAGSDGGIAQANNCYSSGLMSPNNNSNGNGIFSGNSSSSRIILNCYIANDSWSDISINNQLNGKPNPYVGVTWISTGINIPYELNNMGYTPYTITNITTTPSPNLIQTNNVSLNQGDSSISGIVSGLQYRILQISGGSPSSYGTITINNNTGVISTTSSTSPGIYIITIRNTGSYNITSFTLSVIQNITPNVPICFPAGTPVLTDQGEISIEKIDTKVNTIGGKEIVAITETISLDSYLICIERNSLGPNVPNRRVIITKDHKVMCDNKLVRSEFLIRYIPSIYKVQYNKEKLYNVLLKEHSTMSINNLIVETMNPNHILAKIYSQNLTPEEKNILIKILNKYTIQQVKKVVLRNNIFRP